MLVFFNVFTVAEGKMGKKRGNKRLLIGINKGLGIIERERERERERGVA